MKNGYRLQSTSAVYDPNAAAAVAYSSPPQRFVYTANPAAMTQATVPYNNQVHLIVSPCICSIIIIMLHSFYCFKQGFRHTDMPPLPVTRQIHRNSSSLDNSSSASSMVGYRCLQTPLLPVSVPPQFLIPQSPFVLYSPM